jgi:hypothetical protein
MLGIALSVLMISPALREAHAAKGQPNFGPGVWADGQTWGTKFTTELPAPNDNNMDSFDPLFVIVNSNNPEGQLPVSEAGPGNVNYNGGRWVVYTAWWTEQGFADHGTVPVLTSYADLLIHYMLGHLEFEIGSPEGGPPPYFQCPLLPVKD